jgi:hypothetical protein
MAVGALTGVGNYPSASSVTLTWVNDGFDEGNIIVQYYHGGWVTLYSLPYTATTKTISIDDNTSYAFRVSAVYQIGWATLSAIGNWYDTETATATVSSSSSEDIGYADTCTETATVTATGSEVGTYSDTCTETVHVFDDASAATVSPLASTFRYYYGSFDGKVYAELRDATSDDGTAIDAVWESKDLDFGDMFPTLNDRNKTVHKVRVSYVDKSNAASLEVGISTDGGTTWTTRNKSVGTGDGTAKNEEFFFTKTGTYFRFRIRNNSTTDSFQWTRLMPFFTDAGEDFN